MAGESVRKPELAELEAMVSEGEAKAIKLRPSGPIPDQDQVLRSSRERASAIVMDALGLTDDDRSKLDGLVREHDAELRRLADDAKRRAVDRSHETSERLDALASSDRAALAGLTEDWRNPWVPSWPPVYFIRSTPGATITDSHLEEAKTWAKWQCSTPSLSSGTEKLSFFHLWQNSKDDLVLADISVRLNLTGQFECSAEGLGVPAGWFWENRSEADVSARLTIWPMWTAHDPSLQPHHTLAISDLVVTAGVFGHSSDTSINQSPLLRTRRFAVPAGNFILIEASVALDHVGISEVDFASGDFRVGCPTCFVTVPAPQMG